MTKEDKSPNAAPTPGQEQAPADASRPEPQAEQDLPELSPLEAAEAELQKTRDQLLRTAADFDNFRKRSRKELADAERQAREDLLRELLPVFDNLERASEHAKTAKAVEALAQGIDLVMRQFTDSLARLQVQRVASLGESFDPTLHEAIQQQETREKPPGTIVAEVQPGYRIGERLLRPALVVVAKGPASGAETAALDEESEG